MAIGKVEAGERAGSVASSATSLPLLFCAFGVFGGMFGTWQVLLADLSRALGLTPGPLGLALSVGFMLSIPVLSLGGRLGTAGVLRFVRRLTLLRIAGVVGAVGMALSLATTWPPLILCGFLLVGLAFSGIVPVTLSLISILAPDHAGRATAAVMTVAYAGFLVGPPLIGGLAEAVSLRVALATLILTGSTIAVLTSSGLARRALAP